MPIPQANSRAADAHQVVDAAITHAASHGLSSLTLRELAQAIGRSTTVIVNLFGAKAGLIQAVGEEALRRDEAFHADFFRTAEGLPLGRDSLLALVQHYLRLRAADGAGFVRIWETLTLDPEHGEERRDLMRRWHALKVEAWRAHLATDDRTADFSTSLVAILDIEQFYAGALMERPDYQAIAAEGLGGMIDRMLGLPEVAPSATLWYRNRLVLPQAPTGGVEPESMRWKLLDIAADQILASGLTAITNRSVSAVAGTSTSTLAYHWPDMRRFILDAVWHAVFRDMPRYLAGQKPDGDPALVDLDRWAARMAPLASIGPDGEGFYVRYARLISSVCVEARRDASLRDLAMLLRGPEGGGTYYNQAGIWPSEFDLTRLAATRFALWYKGAAMTALSTGVPIEPAELKVAANRLVARKSR
ncbi:TetR/AcrR family transcriptional regulator [Brevundimonas sp.]|uniref:TetR/AcrR family transcriptional regulator n=1 Tax=Brevundimonas sp. TaxID=1871086 RepID=UPI003F7281AF